MKVTIQEIGRVVDDILAEHRAASISEVVERLVTRHRNIPAANLRQAVRAYFELLRALETAASPNDLIDEAEALEALADARAAAERGPAKN